MPRETANRRSGLLKVLRGGAASPGPALAGDQRKDAGCYHAEEILTGAESGGPVAMRRVLPPGHGAGGLPSAAWLLVQAAQLAIETTSVLRTINGVDMNLAEELSAQSEAAALLASAAQAAVIMESQMPLAPSWVRGAPRARAVFARAREAGSDVNSVVPDFVFPPAPPVPPEIWSALAQASREDPVPDAKCAGVTLQGNDCTRNIFGGIGSEHCHSHFTAAERSRHDLLQAARARLKAAQEEAVAAQRRLQAKWWGERYGQHPEGLEVPVSPALPDKTGGHS
jgi:hypothetical protein